MKKFVPAAVLALCLCLLLCALPARAAQTGGATLKDTLTFSWGYVSVAAYDGAAQLQFASSTENGNPDALWEAMSAVEAAPAREDLLPKVMSGKYLQMVLGLSADMPVLELVVNETGELVITRDGEHRSFTGAADAYKQLEALAIQGEKKFSELLQEDSWNTCTLHIDMTENDRLMNYALYGSSAETAIGEILTAAGNMTVRFQGGLPLQSVEARVCLELGGAVQKLQLAVRPDGTGEVSLDGWEHMICAPELYALIAEQVIEYGDNYFAS